MNNTYTAEDVAIAYMAGYAIAHTSCDHPAEALYDYLQSVLNVPSMDAKKATAFAVATVGAAVLSLGE